MLVTTLQRSKSTSRLAKHLCVDLLIVETNFVRGYKCFLYNFFQDECCFEEGAPLSRKQDQPPPPIPQTEIEVELAVDPTKVKMGVGEDVGPTPSQTEEMRSRLKSHIAENGSGESSRDIFKKSSVNLA